ncbi:hypothetical protein SPRG_00036 [Saprolegnia parasitica CBS 223.65]|uniref:Uncharacterized protein n=1 Tax=Saprolegnia parasitica (strain CBS 223.65) TaxID=695850 RepID=A0A067D148_SAPPC|nr:hypothetical protein SPRG_00036 [Saprolegnia parasitica CBS 223.65]KDO35190.1 hypothetical protein SPRG_00036 [Saprolegnia parasitica CBS 223.65]|eukprot:XP_012193542.1 hypothetical protein SPRG_00036 [Saprolegnia parasitica CBS 223.65]
MKTPSSTDAWSKARKSIARANAGAKRNISLAPRPPTLVGGRLSLRALGPILEEDCLVDV